MQRKKFFEGDVVRNNYFYLIICFNFLTFLKVKPDVILEYLKVIRFLNF